MKIDSKYEFNISQQPGEENAEFELFITPEVRAYQAKYSDPLTLAFKLMIDFDKPYGLFAKEKYTDSALAYLKRIGEEVRYTLLNHWIKIFETFVVKYDFLILGCEGIDEIVGHKPHEIFGDDAVISVTVRETADMLCQSLLTQYRSIWYDNNRGVEVLPANLRRFDMYVLIYNAGYFNMGLYDDIQFNKLKYETDVETTIFPTIKKMSESYFIEKGPFRFNHHLIELQDAQINNEQSGKSFFSSLQNEQSADYIKNVMVFNFRFANYKGIFNNLFGDFDFVKTLALFSAQTKFANEVQASLDTFQEKSTALTETFEDTKDNSGDNDSKLKKNSKKHLSRYKQALLGPNSPIGNAIKNYTDPKYYKQLVTSAAGQIIGNLENKYVFGNIAKLNNFIMANFGSDNLLDMFNDAFGEKLTNIEYQDTSKDKFGTKQVNPVYMKDMGKTDASVVNDTPIINDLIDEFPVVTKIRTKPNDESNLIQNEQINIYNRRNF